LAGVPWQWCQFHVQQNAGHFVPRVEMRSDVAADLRAIFDAPDRPEAKRRLEMTIRKYEKSAPKLAIMMSGNAPADSILFFPISRRRLNQFSRNIHRCDAFPIIATSG
jgi:transposase-like protein